MLLLGIFLGTSATLLAIALAIVTSRSNRTYMKKMYVVQMGDLLYYKASGLATLYLPDAKIFSSPDDLECLEVLQLDRKAKVVEVISMPMVTILPSYPMNERL